jgi:peptide/nickel transport system substrate-binding protein
VRWDDRAPLRGREVVAEDARFSLERALRRAPLAARLGPVEAVEATDRHVLCIDLADAFAPFLAALAEPWAAVLPHELEDRPGELRTAESLAGCCGPFLLERHEPGVKAVFARNPGYHARQRPHVDRVEWLFIKERATRLSLFRAGQVDLPFHDGGLTRAEAFDLRRTNPAYPVAYWDGLGGRRLALRADRAPLGDARVRRALALAINRKRWVSDLLDGQGIEDPGPVPPALREWKLSPRALGDGARWLAYDPALARRLLDEAGLPLRQRIRCAVTPGGPDAAVELDRLIASFKDVGVELQPVAEEPGRVEDASWGPVEPATEVDGHLYGAYHSGQPENRSLVSDPRLDALLEAQRRARSRRERRALIDDVQRLVADQVYYLFPPTPQQIASWAPWVRGYQPRAAMDPGAQLESVWVTRRG